MTKRLEVGQGDRRFLLSKRRPPDPDGDVLVRVVDLFSGCGGFSLGVMEACRSLGMAFEVALAIEVNPAIFSTYEANFTQTGWKGPSRVEDWFDSAFGASISPRERAAKRRAGSVDLVIGGPPCQGHSSLNNHTRGRDPKNDLYLRMVRAAEVLEPERLIIENVPAIERDEGDVLTTATARLERLGYHVDALVVSVAQIGAPQLRKRHILVASTSETVDIEDTIEAALVPRPRTLRWAIGDLVESQADDAVDRASTMSAENKRRARWLLKNGAFDLPNRLRPPCHRDKADHKYKSMYGRLRWDEPAQTITTGFGSPGQGRYLHPDQPRTITPHEAARLQFFPDWFSFGSAPFRSALTEAIGNAVPVKLGFVAGVATLAALAQSVSRHTQKVAQGGR
jgi:DNA (cytosine-5)-methyltransferase 1